MVTMSHLGWQSLPEITETAIIAHKVNRWFSFHIVWLDVFQMVQFDAFRMVYYVADGSV